jgi:hypothetical protein
MKAPLKVVKILISLLLIILGVFFLVLGFPVYNDMIWQVLYFFDFSIDWPDVLKLIGITLFPLVSICASGLLVMRLITRRRLRFLVIVFFISSAFFYASLWISDLPGQYTPRFDDFFTSNKSGGEAQYKFDDLGFTPCVIDETVHPRKVTVHLERKYMVDLIRYLLYNKIEYRNVPTPDYYDDEIYKDGKYVKIYDDHEFIVFDLIVEEGKERYWRDRLDKELLFVKAYVDPVSDFGCYF